MTKTRSAQTAANPKHEDCVAVFLLVCLILISATFPIQGVHGQSPPSINNVRWYPYPPTPNDTVSIRVSAKSSIGIRNATIYYKLGIEGITFRSMADYPNRSLMQFHSGNSTNGIWDHDIPPQNNGTTVYFAIVVFDNSGLNSSYPGTLPFSRPQSILIEFPNQAYLSSVIVTINSLTITDVEQVANVSIQMVAYLPIVPDPYYRYIEVVGNGQIWPLGLDTYETENRFYYQGQTSSITYFSGESLSQLPYDTYSLTLDIAIPFMFNNLTYALSPTRCAIYLLSSSSVYNLWNVPKPETGSYTLPHQTHLVIQSTLSRRVAAYYPPLVLMLVAFGVLGLVPLVSIFYHDKRYELFLNVIILASSSELSQTLYPVAGFLGDNIFLEGFAAIMLAAVVMMGFSSLPPRVREWSRCGLQLEWYTTLAVAVLTFLWISLTRFPTTAKVLTLFAGLSGVIIVGILRSYVWYRFRQ